MSLIPRFGHSFPPMSPFMENGNTMTPFSGREILPGFPREMRMDLGGSGSLSAMNVQMNPFLAASLSQDNDNFYLNCPLPGLASKENLSCHVTDNMIILEGTVKKNTTSETGTGSFSSRFRRELGLPLHVDRDRITVSFENNVLNMVFPKDHKATEAPKKILVA